MAREVTKPSWITVLFFIHGFTEHRSTAIDWLISFELILTMLSMLSTQKILANWGSYLFIHFVSQCLRQTIKRYEKIKKFNAKILCIWHYCFGWHYVVRKQNSSEILRKWNRKCDLFKCLRHFRALKNRYILPKNKKLAPSMRYFRAFKKAELLLLAANVGIEISV